MKNLGKLMLLLALVVAPVGCTVEDDGLVTTPSGPSTGGNGNGNTLTGGVGSGGATSSANP